MLRRTWRHIGRYLRRRVRRERRESGWRNCRGWTRSFSRRMLRIIRNWLELWRQWTERRSLRWHDRWQNWRRRRGKLLLQTRRELTMYGRTREWKRMVRGRANERRQVWRRGNFCRERMRLRCSRWWRRLRRRWRSCCRTELGRHRGIGWWARYIGSWTRHCEGTEC